MLEHNRTSTGQKEPTDINKLADEYLRLAYHGLRAKDKTFNAELVTHFEPDLPLVHIIPQDIGRVLLNLFNNAFYAVQQKTKTAGVDYEPGIILTTSAEKGNLLISVKDNGNGIPDAIKDKIMQPFFTTKPTGQGTGLGLSLSYDIVVKGHGGDIAVNSIVGEETVLTVTLPA
jgi:two-component system NtrC family sensor kinase